MRPEIRRIAGKTLSGAYLEACECELRAFKPGNVSVYAAGHGMTTADFKRSAAASAPFICDERLTLGEKIFRAVEATRSAVSCNTNLGIILLAAPLVQACQNIEPGGNLRRSTLRVLAATTVDDAAWTYRAIRLAEPGGLGQAECQDVAGTPTIPLREAMRLAERRDRIAYQYSHGYTDVFDLAIPSYHSALSRWGDEAWAAATVFLGLLKRIPDSHLERKFGLRYTRMVTARAAELESALSRSLRPEQVLDLFHEVDSEFKACGINPGTTADLTVACLLAARLETLLSGYEHGGPHWPSTG